MTGHDPEIAGTLGLDSALEAHGFNLVGVLAVERYDELVPPGWRSAESLPTARSVVLLGCGGADFFRAARGSQQWRAGNDPLDRFARRWVEFQCAKWREMGFETRGFLYADQRESGGVSRFADFGSLAAASGVGVPSRLGILLHPRFGPWFSIRGLLLTERSCPPTARLDWSPCVGCPAPCARACPSDRVLLSSGFDVEACFATKASTPVCRTSCAARRACVHGLDHAYDRETETHFTLNAWLSASSRRSRSQEPGSSG